MLSLVAYNSSDESNNSDSDDNVEVNQRNIECNNKSVGEQKTTSSVGGLFATLPLPKKSDTIKSIPSYESAQNCSMPLEHVLEKTNIQKLPKQPVRITVPSLSEFQDIEPVQKKTKLSKSGSGLIGLLPSPHKTLPEAKKVIPSSVLPKPLPKKFPESVMKYFKTPKFNSDETSNEDAISTDFFSLSNGEPNLPVDSYHELEIDPVKSDEGQDSASNLIGETTFASSATGDVNIAAKVCEQKEVFSESNNNLESYKYDVSQSEISGDFLKDEGFMRLQGKRNRKLEDVSIIDVHADQHLPDPNVYLKTLSEEQPYKPSHNNMPSAQHRRKHQITYLAYQAKERELELKNQWANNRMTRYQTQARYGF